MQAHVARWGPQAKEGHGGAYPCEFRRGDRHAQNKEVVLQPVHPSLVETLMSRKAGGGGRSMVEGEIDEMWEGGRSRDGAMAVAGDGSPHGAGVSVCGCAA